MLHAGSAPLVVQKAIEARGLHSLNRYIKQQVDSLTPAQRQKLEALSRAEILVLKSKIVSVCVCVCVCV